MTNRSEAFWRIVAAFTYLPLALAGFTLFLIIVVVWWIVDVLWQLTLGSEGLSGSRGSEGIVVRFWDNLVGNIEWVILGRGKFQWMP